MKLNKIFAAVAAVLVFCMTAFAETTGDFTSFYVDSTGKTEIIGYFEDYSSVMSFLIESSYASMS